MSFANKVTFFWNVEKRKIRTGCLFSNTVAGVRVFVRSFLSPCDHRQCNDTQSSSANLRWRLVRPFSWPSPTQSSPRYAV